MIRSIGRLGPLKVAGLVIWELRYTLLAVAIAVAVAWHTKAGAAVGHRRHDLAVVAQSWAMEAGR